MRSLEKLLTHMKKEIEINFYCKSNHWSKRMIKIKKIVKKILSQDELKFDKKKFYYLNLIFVNDEKMKNMNQIFRKKNTSTDVLTFVKNLNIYKKKSEVYCDIFFSAETIKKDAKVNLLNFYDHITHLIIHCFLHVIGYDHKNIVDFKKMKNLEEKILLNLNIKSPYLL